MAEGGEMSRTLEDGSEALFDHECTQCRADGRTHEATDFCQDCKQFLCNICGRYHIRYMKTHALVSVGSLQTSKTIVPIASPVPDVAKCHFHPDRDIEMYCGTHDMVYCSLCVAKEHRSCVNVHEIKEVVHKSQLSTLQTLVADISGVDKRLRDTKLDVSNYLKLIKKNKASLLQEINAVRKRTNDHLDALEKKLITELDAEQNKLEKEINAEMDVADKLITAVEQCKPDLTSDYDEKQMFIIEKLARVVLTEANIYLKNTNLPKSPALTYEQNDALCDYIENSDHLGKITRLNIKPKHIQRRNYTAKFISCINVRLTSDKTVCCINDMCQLPDGSILLTDCTNNNLKRLDDQLNVKDFLGLKARPMGLCSVSPTEVAVRMEDKTIHFICVGKSLTYKRQFSMNNFNNVNSGMACCKNHLWIPGAKAVYVYSLSGIIVKKIDSNAQGGRKIFPAKSLSHIAVTDDEAKVYVTAGQDRLVVFNNNGDVIKELRDQRLERTCGICITDDDIVLVTGWSSKNVFIFGRDGNSLGEIVSNKDMLSNPWSLCFDRQKCRLLVSYTLDKVQIFQLIG